MIICGNCGAINTDETSRFCRKCGALLPVPSKPSRIRIPPINSHGQDGEISPSLEKATEDIKIVQKETKAENHQLNRPLGFFSTKSNKSRGSNDSGTSSPPQPNIKPISTENSLTPPVIIDTEDIKKNLEEIPIQNAEKTEYGKREYLKEIKPSPFKGTILASQKAQHPPITKESPPTSSLSKDSVLKQKRLEEDMLDVLAVLSNKLKIPKQKAPKISVPKTTKPDEKMIPESMNEILNQISNLDNFIEASALIKGDGTILASALSDRISDSLFLTIGQNLSMIGSDIIEGLSAGKLNAISIRGSEGILDLAPIDKKIPELKDILLMIFSHPRVKPGIIAFAVGVVRRQIKEYLGIK